MLTIHLRKVLLGLMMHLALVNCSVEEEQSDAHETDLIVSDAHADQDVESSIGEDTELGSANGSPIQTRFQLVMIRKTKLFDFISLVPFPVVRKQKPQVFCVGIAERCPSGEMSIASYGNFFFTDLKPGQIFVADIMKDPNGGRHWSLTTWQNPKHRFDVDGNDCFSENDAVKVIAYLRRQTTKEHPELDMQNTSFSQYFDVDGNGKSTIDDATEIIRNLRKSGDTCKK